MSLKIPNDRIYSYLLAHQAVMHISTKVPAFYMAIARNIKRLEDEQEILTKIVGDHPGYRLYNEAREKVAQKYAKKQKGDPIIEDGKYVIIPSKQRLFDSEIEALGETHKETLEAIEVIRTGDSGLSFDDMSFISEKVFEESDIQIAPVLIKGLLEFIVPEVKIEQVLDMDVVNQKAPPIPA